MGYFRLEKCAMASSHGKEASQDESLEKWEAFHAAPHLAPWDCGAAVPQLLDFLRRYEGPTEAACEVGCGTGHR